MSHTNSTPNYQLPQFVGTDKPAYLTDFNQAFSAIDTGIHAAKTAADTAGTDITEVENELNETNQNLTALGSTVSTLQGTVTSVSQTANQANTKADNLQNAFVFSVQKDFSDSDITNLTGAGSISQNLHCVRNADSSIFKIYGHVQFNDVDPKVITCKITNTGLTIPTAFNVVGFTIREEYQGAKGLGAISMTQNGITFNTDGSIYVDLSGISDGTNFVRLNFIACLIFNQNFGD